MDLLNCSFKGERDYVQGGDVFNLVSDYFLLNNSGFLHTLVLKSIARNKIGLLLNSPSGNYSIIGHGKWVCDSIIIPFWLVDTDFEICDQNPFDESVIISDIDLIEIKISSTGYCGFTLIENIISLTKCLCYASTPLSNGKWIFAQISLLGSLRKRWSQIIIKQTTCLHGKFARNEIEIDGNFIGEIRFIVWDS